jgi:hypothetical protein
MTYILAAIILSPITVVVFAKWMKRRLDRNHPDFDSEGEIEEFLADGLAVCLSQEIAR